MDEISKILEPEGYFLEDPIATDSWGELYRARYAPHSREVLLRRFPPALKDKKGATDLLWAEIQAWARLDHPGILQPLDWGMSGGEIFLSMSAPPGRRLRDILPGDEGIEACRQVFEKTVLAVEFARQWGVLHLGLGPDTLWIGPGGEVLVSDFGFWYVQREYPGLVTCDGTFLAPEQKERAAASAAADVYALGVLYLALSLGLETAGVFSGRRGLPEGIERSMSSIVSRALQPEPVARFHSAGALARELGLQGPETAGAWYRECPVCRLKRELAAESEVGEKNPGSGGARRKRLVSYAWVFVAVLAGFTLILWWMALR